MNKPLLIVIAGPTASGKTPLAVSLAQKLKTEIINADSRQFYKEFDIGVARPSKNELEAVKHHFVADRSIDNPLSAGEFAKEASEVLKSLLEKFGCAIVSGGSGLYINALIIGLDELAPFDARLRAQVNTLFEEQGVDGLVAELRRIAPLMLDKIDTKNPARLKRAIEIVRTTLSRPKFETKRPANIIDCEEFGFYLHPERAALYQKIEQRVDDMMKAGLEIEARNVYNSNPTAASKTVGYTELFDYFSNKIGLETAINLIKQHTRNYAKRQITWFKNKTNFTPLLPDNAYHTIFETLKNHGYTIHK